MLMKYVASYSGKWITDNSLFYFQYSLSANYIIQHCFTYSHNFPVGIAILPRHCIDVDTQEHQTHQQNSPQSTDIGEEDTVHHGYTMVIRAQMFILQNRKCESRLLYSNVQLTDACQRSRRFKRLNNMVNNISYSIHYSYVQSIY